MNTLKAINERKSTREFCKRDVSKEYIEKILSCGMRAPSPKNSQPWRFLVVQSKKKKEEVADILEKSLQRLKSENELAGVPRDDLVLAQNSVNVLKNASVLIFVFLNDDIYLAHDDGVRWNLNASDIECTHIQAIGASIQNILLAATELGIDSLWLGDVFYAYHELIDYLEESGCMMAAVALGYGKESKAKTRRKRLEEKVKWLC